MDKSRVAQALKSLFLLVFRNKFTYFFLIIYRKIPKSEIKKIFIPSKSNLFTQNI